MHEEQVENVPLLLGPVDEFDSVHGPVDEFDSVHHELVRQKLVQDPSLASLFDILDPSANVITVTGMRCVGVPIGTPEFVQAYVRAKAVEIGSDVQKLSIITDPKLHYDLLRFCQHTLLGFLSRTLSPDVMMTSANGEFSHGVCQALCRGH